MTLFNKCLLPVLALFLANACSTESVLPLPDEGGGQVPADPSRREVLLTLKNTLKIPDQTKADDDTPIATERENFISTLDVYVFGSDNENSDNYTFQELFYFREDGATIDKKWATRLNFKQEKDKAQALLRIQKGLYVRIYCIANDTTLINPDNGKQFTIDNFSELEQEQSIVSGITVSKVKVEGVPNEEDFKKLRTRLIDPTDEEGYLRTPLPMTGSYLTPVDLTDFSVSARTQMGFKMVRTVARFDVVNDATKSRFTIRDISLGKGRSGVTFFPVKPTDDAQITYPVTPFVGEQTTDNNTTTGALYSYPSPAEDEAYLILNGTYEVNLTEQKSVTYQVPFKQVTDDKGVFIDIAQNHRYTLYITDADEYHLEANIAVSDWDDAGNIDDYKPDNVIKNEHITLLSGTNATYDNVSCVVRLLQDASTKFVLKVTANSQLQCKLVNSDIPWIQPDDTHTPAGPNEFAFKAVDNIYSLPGSLPDLSISITNLASGKSKVVRVVQMPGPDVILSENDPKGNLNKYDKDIRTITLYNAPSQNVLLHATGTDGKDVTTEGIPAWLTVTPKAGAGVASAEDDFTVQLTSAQDLKTISSGTFYFVSNQAKTAVKVNLKDITMTMTGFLNGGNGNNTFNKDTNTIGLATIPGNSFSIMVNSPEGCDTPVINWTAGTPDDKKWFDISAATEVIRPDGSRSVTLTGTIVSDAPAAGEEVTVTIPNKIDPTNSLTLTVKTN